MTASAQRYLSAGVLTVWGVMLMHFYVSGRVASYLHPAFHLLTVISGIVLLLLAVGLLFLRVEEEDCCEAGCASSHSHDHRPGRSFVSAFVLIVPLLVAAMVSPDQFGEAVVTNRGYIEQINDLPGYKPSIEPSLPSADSPGAAVADDRNEDYLPRNEAGQIKAQTVDLIYAAEEPTMRADFEGKAVELIGQFMPERADNAKGDRFNLVRMFVMCCAADARPVAISVRTERAQSVAEMSWVRVTGKAAFPVESGRRVPIVLAESVTPCDPPEETFIY